MRTIILRKYIYLLASVFGILFGIRAQATENLDGRVLLAVESGGAMYYVNGGERYCLQSPYETFQVMRGQSLGIRHEELSSYLEKGFPSRLDGRILLDIGSHGEAYYVNMSHSADYLGRPGSAFWVMAGKALGIKDEHLEKIPLFRQGCAYDYREKTFKTKKWINWNGRIIGQMNSFLDYAVERELKDKKVSYFYFSLDNDYWKNRKKAVHEGRIRVSGYLSGMTCAYSNTYFKGECVPEVDVRSISAFR